MNFGDVILHVGYCVHVWVGSACVLFLRLYFPFQAMNVSWYVCKCDRHEGIS